MRNIFQVKDRKYSANTGGESPSLKIFLVDMTISYTIRTVTLEQRSFGIPRQTDIDEADKICLRDVGIQLNTDSFAGLRIFIFFILIHPDVLE